MEWNNVNENEFNSILLMMKTCQNLLQRTIVSRKSMPCDCLTMMIFKLTQTISM